MRFIQVLDVLTQWDNYYKCNEKRKKCTGLENYGTGKVTQMTC